jgi:hypothetical protein
MEKGKMVCRFTAKQGSFLGKENNTKDCAKTCKKGDAIIAHNLIKILCQQFKPREVL